MALQLAHEYMVMLNVCSTGASSVDRHLGHSGDVTSAIVGPWNAAIRLSKLARRSNSESSGER